MGDKFKDFIIEQSEKEAEAILKEAECNLGSQNVEVPDSAEAELLARIDAYEKYRAETKTAEEKELIELGKRYKKRKKINKKIAAVALIACALSVSGVTAIGGAEKVLETFRAVLGGREQTGLDSDDEQIAVFTEYDEGEAYLKIEEEFGVKPVKLDYLPEGMAFKGMEMHKELQSVCMHYSSEDGSMIQSMIYLNYRTGSLGEYMDDKLLEETSRVIDNVLLHIKKYHIEDSNEIRYLVVFENEDIYQWIDFFDMSENDVWNTIDNLYFSY